MPNKLSKSRFGETGMSFKSQQDEKISRLRENFVEYLLRGKEWLKITKFFKWIIYFFRLFYLLLLFE